ncbi:hypothetical protein [Actinoallomurus rhizosphaericola]|uniref:hypothetical protein n=1 Tax=Actinoallomurus rhizosphaericola TaxID=2952536 RepID=UPI0020923184|nr:hypothetical protein [Actinoallomurus rhizosphaericola]MCO5996904.1 hypothetical protein [Actinoallomurus rhizosphaericola]
MSPLEHRLRRWLRLYPADRREEMLGVLLATAGPGQERPTVRDTADLVGGAVRIRLRREVRSLGGPVWRDAFAVLALVTTALACTALIACFRNEAVLASRSFIVLDIDSGRSYADLFPEPAQVWPMWAPWPLVGALSLLRLRRPAVGLAWAAALSQLPWLAVAQGRYALQAGDVEGNLMWFGLAVLAASALSLSDGLRHALALLGRWRGITLLVGVTTFACALLGPAFSHYEPSWSASVSLIPVRSALLYDPRWVPAVGALALILVSCARPRSASGRRSFAVALLALSPLLGSLALWFTTFTMIGPASIALLTAVFPALLAIMAGAFAARFRGRRRSAS